MAEILLKIALTLTPIVKLLDRNGPFCTLQIWIVLDCQLLIASSVFFNVDLSCVLYTQCCQFPWIVHF